jgi:uncharacterized membrane protein
VFWKILILVVMTFVPTLELRASIPYGYWEAGLSPVATVAICVLANIALAPLVWLLVDKGIHVFLKFDWIDRLYSRVVERARAKLRPYVERWGTVGLALFIGVPLPGSGVYSGGLGAYLLGFSFSQFIVASVIGVLIAGALVTAIVVSGMTGFDLFLKH